MTGSDAYALLALVPPARRLAMPSFIALPGGEQADVWPCFAAGLAALSGQLEAAETPADLDLAVASGLRLVRSGKASLDAWVAEARRIARESQHRDRQTALVAGSLN